VTDQQAEEIKRLYAAGGISQQRLAERYGLEQTSVSYIIRRRRVRST
jgi:transcriptional regulator with XRE-family HTH domain